MALYSSFSTSQYYDNEPVKKVEKTVVEESKQTPAEYKKPHQIPNEYGLTQQKRRSLYDEAVKVASSSDSYTGPDFRQIYRVGQSVAIVGPNGNYRTQKGSIVEIVEKNLMYVYMEDSYRDVNNNWQVDFVTDKDTIIKL